MKKTRILIGIAIFAVFMTIISTAIDLHLWAKGTDETYIRYSILLRFARTLVIALGVFGTNLLEMSQKQHKYLSLAFAFALIADFFLICKGKLAIGILFFAFMQITLMLRHIDLPQLSKQSKGNIYRPIVSGLLFWGGFVIFSYSALHKHFLHIPILIYGLLLVASCVVAWFSRWHHAISSPQNLFIFWGMILFLLCDITVVMPVIAPQNATALLLRAVTSVFYTPTLVLLSFSAINFPKNHTTSIHIS